jgi:hypothetical protein
MENNNLNPDRGEHLPKVPSREEMNFIVEGIKNINEKENRIQGLEKQSRIAWFVVVFIIFFLSILIIYILKNSQKQLASQLKETTWIKDNLHLTDLAPNERREKFRKLMIRIMNVHGHTYRPKNVKAMNREQKAQYIRLLYEAAEDFRFGYWMVPTLHKKESDFNPIQDGPCHERGLGQIKWLTAMGAQGYLKCLPTWLEKKYKFELHKPEDLYDPIINTKVTFVLLYMLRNIYLGNELWYVSIYHWGGFLSRYFDRGRGQIPKAFVINDISYDVAEYITDYWTWKETFEMGELEPGKDVALKWEGKKRKMLQEEVKLNTAYKEMNKVRRQLTKVKKSEKELIGANAALDKSLKRLKIEFKKIYGEAQTFKGKDIRVLLSKGKGIVREWLKEQKKKDDMGFYLMWIFFISGVLAGGAVMILGFKYIIFTIIKKINKIKKARKARLA